jgi:hypothetical protein
MVEAASKCCVVPSKDGLVVCAFRDDHTCYRYVPYLYDATNAWPPIWVLPFTPYEQPKSKTSAAAALHWTDNSVLLLLPTALITALFTL